MTRLQKAKLVALSVMITLAFLIAIPIAQTPLTNALNLRVKTDAAGSLLTSVQAYTGPDGPLTNLANIRVRTDSNGYLLTTTSTSGSAVFAASDGTCTTDSPSITFAAQTTLGFARTISGAIDGCSAAYSGTVPFIRLQGGEGAVLPANLDLAFTSTNTAGGTVDTRISRGGVGEPAFTTVTFTNLGTPANGTIALCTDCAPTTPASCPGTKASCVCAGSGVGSFAVRVNATWYCPF